MSCIYRVSLGTLLHDGSEVNESMYLSHVERDARYDVFGAAALSESLLQGALVSSNIGFSLSYEPDLPPEKPRLLLHATQNLLVQLEILEDLLLVSALLHRDYRAN